MSKKLLIVTQHFWPENFRINDIVDGFLADGIAVDVLCGLPNYPKGEWFDGYEKNAPMREDYRGAQLYRCREIPRKGNTSLRIFCNYISFPLTASFALHRLSGGYDAVLCYNTSPVLMSFPAILASRKFKAPLTNYVLDIWPENLYSVLNIQNTLLRRIASAVSDWHYRRADRLIAMSDGLETRLRARVGVKNARGCVAHASEKRYAVIPQYCEDFYKESACDATLKAENSGKFTLLFAGNFSPAQSLCTALSAIALLKEQAHTAGKPFALQLLLVGDGMSRDALAAQSEALGITDCVRFYGSVAPTQIPALCGACDALLVSLSDSPDLGLTIPAKLASCLAARKPLLVSMNGEGAHAARESGAAFVSDATDAAALAANFAALAALPEGARAAMGDAGFAYYEKHYSRTKLLRALEDFILDS